jgi:hypothetical protein
MNLYSKSLNRLDIDLRKVERINRLVITNAYIYRYLDLIIKKYWVGTQYAITDEVFELLSAIKNKHLMELYEIFTLLSDTDYEQKHNDYLRGKNSFVMDGYTAKFYQTDDINPLLENSSYLLTNIEELKELVEIISHKHIIMEDTKIENAIIQRQGIVLIDPDFYHLSTKSIEEIRNKNYRELFCLLRNIFEDYGEDLQYFMHLRGDNALEKINAMEQELKRVRRPIDLRK